jgi:hypothetical protein
MGQRPDQMVKVFLRPHLRPNDRVVHRIEMLTYCVYAPLLNRIDDLEAYLNLIRLDMSSRDSGVLEPNLRP